MTCHSYFSHFAEEWCSHGGLAQGHRQHSETTNPAQIFAFRNQLSQMFVAPNFRDENSQFSWQLVLKFNHA